MQIIEEALAQGKTTLSESESKKILSEYGIPVTMEKVVSDPHLLEDALKEIPFPVAMKGCASDLAHKTESGLIRLDIRTPEEAKAAFSEIMEAMQAVEDKGVLVQEMVKGKRELVAGLTRDPQFGPCVMFGLGGIFTEVLKDISFRVAPLTKQDALEMMDEIKGSKILEAVRGMEPADTEALARILMALGALGMENDNVAEVDINPLILSKGKPIAVDALVVLKK